MKKARRGALSIISRALVILLVIALLPFAKDLYRLIMPDVTGEIAVQSRILQQKLESSQRMEVTRIEEEGVLEAKTNVIIFGTVGSTTIRYRYTASFGIDLKKVKMTAESDRITFVLPDIEVLVAGHHGSRTSTCPRLLEETRPDVAIISVGYNTYGHPSPEVLSRLEAYHISVLRTDREGRVTVAAGKG